jgi:hypothetical protein
MPRSCASGALTCSLELRDFATTSNCSALYVQFTLPDESVQQMWHRPPLHDGQQNKSVPVHVEPQSESVRHAGAVLGEHAETLVVPDGHEDGGV